MSLFDAVNAFFFLTRKEQRGLLVLCLCLTVLLIVRIGLHRHPLTWDPPGPDVSDLPAGGPDTLTDRSSMAQAEGPDTAIFRPDARPEGSGAAGSQPATAPSAATSPSASVSRRPATRPASRAAPDQMEINQADTAAWKRLRGIGRVLSARIVSYRELLGGFYCTDQLKEVYGLRSGLVDTLSAQLYADSTRIRKLHLSSAAYRDLLRHPYLSEKQVKDIFRYFDIMGRNVQPADLLEDGILEEATYLKIRPYLAP